MNSSKPSQPSLHSPVAGTHAPLFFGMQFTLLFTLLLTLLLLLVCSSRSYAQQIAVKTNALYWLTSTPNFAVEVGIDRKLSVQLSVGYNAWKLGNQHSMKHTMVIPEARYWLSRTMERHYAGAYAQYGHFNLRNAPLFKQNDRAYRGRLYGGGVSYGYQWALGKRFGLEASIGVGYLYFKYSQYQYTDCCAERLSDHRRSYFGPTKAAVNLIYVIR